MNQAGKQVAARCSMSSHTSAAWHPLLDVFAHTVNSSIILEAM